MPHTYFRNSQHCDTDKTVILSDDERMWTMRFGTFQQNIDM